jgi:nucleotide-binding universal stress UspA family protein
MASPYKIKTIVVGVDFSKASKSALRQARQLAKMWKTPFVVIHVLDNVLINEKRFGRAIKEMTSQYREKIIKHYDLGKNETLVIKSGRPYEQILKTAKEYQNSLVLIANQGQGGIFSKIFLGSTAERVARHASMPIWIHRDSKKVEPKRILVPSDFSDRAGRTKQFLQLNKLGSGKTEFFHVLTPAVPLLDFETWESMNAQIELQNSLNLKKFKKAFPSIAIQEKKGNIFIEIKKRAKHFDLIALSPRKDKGFLKGFGSVTSGILHSGHKPILIIP